MLYNLCVTSWNNSFSALAKCTIVLQAIVLTGSTLGSMLVNAGFVGHVMQSKAYVDHNFRVHSDEIS